MALLHYSGYSYRGEMNCCWGRLMMMLLLLLLLLMMMMLLYRRMMIEGYLMRYHKTILW
jgi:hypothetical protein